jgi:hypothetical protein
MWRAAFIEADEPTEDKDDELFEECLGLAREEGVELAELNEAAGGDLRSFVARRSRRGLSKYGAGEKPAKQRRRNPPTFRRQQLKMLCVTSSRGVLSIASDDRQNLSANIAGALR